MCGVSFKLKIMTAKEILEDAISRIKDDDFYKVKITKPKDLCIAISIKEETKQCCAGMYISGETHEELLVKVLDAGLKSLSLSYVDNNDEYIIHKHKSYKHKFPYMPEFERKLYQRKSNNTQECISHICE